MLRDDLPPDSPDDAPGTPTDSRVSIQQVLDHFKELAGADLTEQGDLWEQLIIVFLREDPTYKGIFKNVRKFPGQDLGIDIIAEERDTGRRWAFQAKFYTAGNVSMADIDSFMSAAEGYDERVVVSTRPLGDNAKRSLTERPHPGLLWSLEIFEQSRLDFAIFLEQAFFENRGDLQPRHHAFKELRPHQVKAVADVIKGFETHDRGKMIMACGTGKTFTALKLAEQMVPPGGSVLVLTPSLSLVSQTLHEWSNETQTPFRGAAVCSDTHVRESGKADEDEESPLLRLNEFRFPVTTDARELIFWFRERAESPDKISVVYSTYHSIEAVSVAQKIGKLPDFDLIICDEAHRTASTRKMSKRESYFTRVHDKDFIRAKKRLYMTATPKIYRTKVIKEAEVKEVAIYSMDDETQYGPEFHRLGFRSAVKAGLLSEYKVLILLVNEGLVEKKFREYMRTYNDSNKGKEIPLDEMARLVGCLNGLRKYRLDEDNTSPLQIVKIKSVADLTDIPGDKEPMRRALAFLNTIKDSKRFMEHLHEVAPEFADTFKVEGRHVDSNMNAYVRNNTLEWLRESTEGEDPPECRILSNVRCLSEGVDVPAMDAVMFLAPRKSKIDIVQSIGRVMRVAPGKKYGYIILPIAVPEEASSDEEIQEALSENERYAHILEILEALRSHDEHFNIYINQLALNEGDKPPPVSPSLPPFEEEREKEDVPWQEDMVDRYDGAIRATVANHLSTRWYWKTWATQVGENARETSTEIHKMLKEPSSEVRPQFDAFLNNLQATLNSSVGKDDAVDMLAQHIVARPVFDALFKDYEFAKQNPVSQAMQKMLDILLAHGLEQGNDEIRLFYDIVKRQVDGISTSGRQKLILEIYDNFFRAVFPKTAESLGIVYTPPEIVDFILRSVNHISKKEFGKPLADEGVRILDPFTGTGTFMARLIQSDLIPDDDALRRKFLGTPGSKDYNGEFHANEIVLLAYYIAAVNIEEAYHTRVGGDYQPFGGILFGDTFQMAEEAQKAKGPQTFGAAFPGAGFSEDNSRRAEAQNQHPIRVIVANPPYSVGQKSANDANQNLEYPHLNKRIKDTYANPDISSSKKTAMYDSSILALRMASDRIGDEGIIGFVTNGYFLDSGSAASLRYCLLQEFSHIYCFNLRGNIRMSGEKGKEEGGNVFGNKSSVSVVILILVKKANDKAPGTFHYHDIGDSLTQKEKLDIITDFGSIENIPWQEITPNKYHDWLTQRSEALHQFIPVGIKETKGEADTKSIFTNYSLGIKSNRDAWVHNFSREKVEHNMQAMIKEYNRHVEEMTENPSLKTKDYKEMDTWINNDPKQIKWADSLKDKLGRQERLEWQSKRMALSHYRPFAKKHFYYEPNCFHSIYQQAKFFPTPEAQNKMICVSGLGSRKDFSVLMVGSVPAHDIIEKAQCFPLYAWEKEQAKDMLPAQLEASRQDNITDYALSLFRTAYPGTPITKEDIFYYVYGVLHSPEYRARFDGDLKKILASIPLAHDFDLFRDAGRELAELHLYYEAADPFMPPSLKFDETTTLEKSEANFAHYRVQKMKFGKLPKVGKTKSIIHYNDHVAPLTNIPQEAFKYQINGRSAIEWVMDQYQVKKDKDSGIENDPNDLAREHDNPRYILDLLLRVITVSLGTMKIINSLPTKKSFREDPKTLNLIKTFTPPRNGGA